MYIFDSNTFPQTAKTINGIDTLYYFYETNSEYDNLFLDILDQIEDAKAMFLKRDIHYNNNDIEVVINNHQFLYGGKKRGLLLV